MPDSSQIVEYVQDMNESEPQKVLLAKNQIISKIIAGAVFSVLMINLVYIGIGMVLLFPQTINPLDVYTQHPLVAALVALIILSSTLLFAKDAVLSSDIALEFFSEGFVCYKHWSDKRRRKGKETAYKAIEEIVLEGIMHVSMNRDVTDEAIIKHSSEASLTRFWDSVQLRVSYKNGKSKTWYPSTMFQPARFDSPQEIAQQIIQDFQAFKQNHSE